MWLNVIGWTATAVFSSSYFFKEAATLRRIQAAAASLWVLYGVAIHSAPVVVADLTVGIAAIDLEPPSRNESMTDLRQGCHVASGVLISKSLIEINRFLALDS